MAGRRFAIATLLAGLFGCASSARVPIARETSPPASGRVEVIVAATSSDTSVSLRTTGSFDRSRHRVDLTVDLRAVDAGMGIARIIAIDDAVYIDCPYLTRIVHAATRWLVVRGSVGAILGIPVIDELGFVADTTMRFDAQREGGSALVSVRYFDVGATIVIEPPPPDQVTDATSALGG